MSTRPRILRIQGDDPLTRIQGIEGRVEIIARDPYGRDIWLSLDRWAVRKAAQAMGCAMVPGCFKDETKEKHADHSTQEAK